MGSRPITREVYEALLASFRSKPANFSAASRASGVDRRTATRGWHEGWAHLPFARPIKVALEEEHAAKVAADARAAAVERDPAQRRTRDERERANAIIRDEQRVIALARGNVMALLGSLGLLAKGLRDSAEKLGVQLEKGELDPKAAGPLFRNIASAIGQGSRAAHVVVALERRAAGDPRAKADASAADDGPLPSLEEALAGLAADNAVLERAAKRGALVSEPARTSPAAAPPVAPALAVVPPAKE